jgi:hypothetical protein
MPTMKPQVGITAAYVGRATTRVATFAAHGPQVGDTKQPYYFEETTSSA